MVEHDRPWSTMVDHSPQRGGVQTPSRDPEQMSCNPIEGGENSCITENLVSASIAPVGLEIVDSPRVVELSTPDDASPMGEASNPSSPDIDLAAAQVLIADHLGIDESWARNCLEAEAKRRKLGEQQDTHTVEDRSEDAVNSVTPCAEVNEEALRGLLELCEVGETVAWPTGFDAITAKAYLKEFDKL